MSKFQEIIGETLKHFLGQEVMLVNYRPEWLFGMELDFYFPDRRFAIEVQGIQHYVFTPAFHKNRGDLREQKWRDGNEY